MTFTSSATGFVFRVVRLVAHASQDEPAGADGQKNKRADLNDGVPHGLEPLSPLARVLVLVRRSVVGHAHAAPDGDGGGAEQKGEGQNL